MTDLFKPRGAGSIRKPTSDEQRNGPIVNPPRYAKLGGLKSAASFPVNNSMSIKKPGDGKKVI